MPKRYPLSRRARLGEGFSFLIILFLIAPSVVRSQEESRAEKGADRINIVGEVVDAQGRPIEGVDITLSAKDGGNRDRVIARERTNKSGEYLFECLDRDQYQATLSSRAAGVLEGTTDVDVRKDGLILDWRGTQTETQSFSHFLDTCCRKTTYSDEQARTDERDRGAQDVGRRGRASLGGVVVDGDRRPVPGVEVYARNRRDTIVARGVTNDKGEYFLECLVRGTYSLTLDPRKTQFQGKTTVVHVGTGGVVVNWRVSTVTSAVTTLHRGTCCGAAVALTGLPALILGGGALGGAGVGAAIAIDDDPRRPESPSQ
jgi:Carboxypeptidase regulatory-like domain